MQCPNGTHLVKAIFQTAPIYKVQVKEPQF